MEVSLPSWEDFQWELVHICVYLEGNPPIARPTAAGGSFPKCISVYQFSNYAQADHFSKSERSFPIDVPQPYDALTHSATDTLTCCLKD
ncbi:hypothetical protein AVEN_187886-1 [Araneus ventricosus]|uniref:Uncharacterized protein n=1 Tax=Araneus ventricosus TaxID=182803 RepID=A0A4Y2CTW1_ARAVE|nr:hypothetical protein AVEN_187886-1 [Araneus ventricosus]